MHQHGSEEEIFFVLEGSGLAWIDGAVHEIGPGDTLVYLAGGPLHTVIAGDDGLSVLAYGENHAPPLVRLPRAGMVRRGEVWLEASHDDPLEREAAAGPLELPEPTPRPPCSVALEDVELEADQVGEVDTDRARRRPRRRLGAHRPAPRRRRAGGAELPAALARAPSTSSSSSSTARARCGSTTTRATLAEEHALRPGHCVVVPGRHAPAPTPCAPASRA